MKIHIVLNDGECGGRIYTYGGGGKSEGMSSWIA